MKNTYLLVLTIALAILSACKPNSSKGDAPSMVGVRRMTITEVEASHRFGKSDMGDTISVVVSTYDEEGKIIQECTYDEDGLDVEKIYTYSDTLVKVRNYKEMGVLSYFTTEEFTYNSHGKLIHRIYEHGDEFVEEDFYAYDDHGNEIYHKATSTDVGGFGNYEESTDYTYDDNGRIVTSTLKKQHLYSNRGPYISKKEYKYNEDGTTEINGNDDEFKYRWVYDKFKNIIEANFITRYEYEYDKQNRVVKMVTYVDDMIESYKFFEYEFYE